MKGDDVRFGSKADIGANVADVRFTPESGHFRIRLRCPLSAKSGHWFNHSPRSLLEQLRRRYIAIKPQALLG